MNQLTFKEVISKSMPANVIISWRRNVVMVVLFVGEKAGISEQLLASRRVQMLAILCARLLQCVYNSTETHGGQVESFARVS